MNCYALIPAGGKSTRMGRPKLALKLGGQPLIKRVVTTLHEANIADVLVVLGPHVAELAPLAHGAGAHVHLLPAETATMRATLEAGLDWLEATLQPQPTDYWLLAPADHPALDAELIRRLLDIAREQPGQVLIPTWESQRGHPVIIPWQLVAEIRAWPADQGINRLFRQPGRSIEVPVDNPDVLLDLDTPAEYEQFQSRFRFEN